MATFKIHIVSESPFQNVEERCLANAFAHTIIIVIVEKYCLTEKKVKKK